MDKAKVAKDIIAKVSAPDSYGYIHGADSARLVRAVLADEFPGTKFWVRSSSYSGGSSVDIYFDGTADGAPSKAAVKDIINGFGGSSFDGMIDMQYSYHSWLTPSGKVVLGGTSGTAGSRGSVPGFENVKPAGAVRVEFMPYFFVNDYKPYGAA